MLPRIIMASVLVLYAHPAPHKSRINRRLAAAAREVEGVTFRDLYELYPDFLIDVEEEQRLLKEHDIIVLQHPFYWYSAPSLVKEYLDLVLTYGWAYGEGGTALQGKTLIHAISAGGSEEFYCSQGRNRFTIRQLLAPFDQTAFLCGMRYIAPHVIHGANQLADHESIMPHAQRYARLLRALRDETLPIELAVDSHKINDLIPA
ncbi:NAD(P)H-dependent oxidoreductase [Prosthecobacter sp.]|uniref:glutathione-regulated potassium-efflux system oxidoreductase KefF n=1 Tax=Prosthecobacter sp. TaxID=1965333 RepID=UPI003783DB3E